MKTTMSSRMARLQGRIRKYLKKSQASRRFVLMMIVIWTVMPALSVNAADSSDIGNVEPIVTNVTLGQNLQNEQIKFGVEVRQSPHQIAKKQAEIRQSAITIKPISGTEEEKRDWVKKAATQWGIDWKILEAVWQVESGKQMSTTVRSYAGAQGPLQFMPGTWRGFAQDGNGDGSKNVFDARDSLFAAAKLLAVNGASTGNVDGALLRYNHSLAYVAKVKRIATGLGD